MALPINDRLVITASFVKSEIMRLHVRTAELSATLKLNAMFCFFKLFMDDLVVMAKVPTPDPIPNSEVKTFSADGTLS